MSLISIVVATEGPASQAVLSAICRKAGAKARVLAANGKGRLHGTFEHIFARHPHASRFILAPDLHPETDCVEEATRWRLATTKRFPSARVCLAIWESESWLLADPTAVKAALGIDLKITQPEAIGGQKPSEIIEQALRKANGYNKGSDFDKAHDGVKIVERMDLTKARKLSPSLNRFLVLLQK